MTLQLGVSHVEPAVNVSVDQKFSIMQITDTQFLSMRYPNYFDSLADWIILNSAGYNLKMVVHTGDIVHYGDDTGQWINANAAMSRLLNAGVPYCWNAGNHDQSSIDRSYDSNPNGGWLGSQFIAFNAVHMRDLPYWVSDMNDGKSTAAQFSCGNYSFLVINMEFHATHSTLNWMVNLIEQFPDYNVIVATHSYLNGLGTYGYPDSPETPEWENSLKAILDEYDNVFLVLSGHCLPTKHAADGTDETSCNIRVNNREETFFNRQNALGNLGAASVRIYEFDLADPQLTAQACTYDLFTGAFLGDRLDSYVFPNTLQKQVSSQRIAFPLPSLAPSPTETPLPPASVDTSRTASVSTPTQAPAATVSSPPTPDPTASPTPVTSASTPTHSPNPTDVVLPTATHSPPPASPTSQSSTEYPNSTLPNTPQPIQTQKTSSSTGKSHTFQTGDYLAPIAVGAVVAVAFFAALFAFRRRK
ncbi:MAG: metallophosphoesterase [Candidatus Bathyarchaeota archaeon]|nr:metallophosphoesterase [Candidatus Bathyarchaeota archaeon]